MSGQACAGPNKILKPSLSLEMIRYQTNQRLLYTIASKKMKEYFHNISQNQIENQLTDKNFQRKTEEVNVNNTIQNFKILDNAKIAYNISVHELKKSCTDDIHKPTGMFDYSNYLKEIEIKKFDFPAMQSYYTNRMEEIERQIEVYEQKKQSQRLLVIENQQKAMETKKQVTRLRLSQRAHHPST